MKHGLIIFIVLSFCATAVFCVWYYADNTRYEIVEIKNRPYKIDRKTGRVWKFYYYSTGTGVTETMQKEIKETNKFPKRSGVPWKPSPTKKGFGKISPERELELLDQVIAEKEREAEELRKERPSSQR